MTSATKPPVRRPRTETRELILDAVDTLFGRSGYARMTIEDVAREAGIGKGSIYLHFASKEDLALSSIDRLIERLLAGLRELAASDRPVAERLARMLEARVLYRFDNVNQDSQSLDAMLSGIRTAFLVRREVWFEMEAEVFTAVLVDGAASGELDVDDPAATARLLITATNSLLPYSLSKLELGRRSLIAERIARLAELLLTGLVRRDAARPPESPVTGGALAAPPSKGPRS